MPDLVVLGNFVTDLIGKPIDRLPERGQLALIDTLETHVGGNGPNTAGALARLGASVAVVGRVGDDLYGRFLLERLSSWGVDTSPVGRVADGTTGVTLVPVDSTGERSFIHHFGVNATFGPEHVAWDRLAGARHFHFGSFFVLPRFDGVAAAEVLSEARGRGMTTSLDVCWDREGRWMESLRPALAFADYIIPSEEEARQLTGREEPAEMGAALIDAGCAAAVIKLGERGCFYAGPDGERSVPAFAVPVRDTTGAGDCFIAGFLLALRRGKGLCEALRFGNACGARSVSAVGGVTGLGPAEEIEEWAREAPLRKETSG